ncbi:MAG: ATP-binding protein [Bacteroidetes bacterium]|nr:ATP-binding protein [Bacteroidota bacterium]
MKRLPIGVQDFAKLREDNYLYIDKTAQLEKLVSGYNYAFISRPRRFGKSLFVATMEEFFKGNRELFNGLHIYNFPKWESFPIIRLDFSRISHQNPEVFQKSLVARLQTIAREHDIEIDASIESEFMPGLIEALQAKYQKRVVILVDEYDKPIIDYILQPEIADGNRDILRNLFSSLKSLDDKLRFVFLTGVTRFSKVSLFSGLNQISDLTLSPSFSTTFGYTQEELIHYFEGHIKKIAKSFSGTRDQLLQTIKFWYNGYSWDGKNTLYNPFSILSLFTTLEFQNYWFATGSPAFLMKLIKEKSIFFPALQNAFFSGLDLENHDVTKLSLGSLLFQTGYLTVKSKTSDLSGVEYQMDYPNFEVKDAFYKYLSSEFTNSEPVEVTSAIRNIRNSFLQEDFQLLLDTLKSLFAQIPSNLYISAEKYYHSLFIMIMYLSGIKVESEVNTNIGRIDGVVEFPDKIYIIEFKYNLPPEEGLQQIKQKKYYEKYLSSGKRLILVGVSFTRSDISLAVE